MVLDLLRCCFFCNRITRHHFGNKIFYSGVDQEMRKPPLVTSYSVKLCLVGTSSDTDVYLSQLYNSGERYRRRYSEARQLKGANSVRKSYQQGRWEKFTQRIGGNICGDTIAVLVTL